MLVYRKNKSAIHLHVIPVMKRGYVFWEFAKRKLATRKDKIKIMKNTINLSFQAMNSVSSVMYECPVQLHKMVVILSHCITVKVM
jgi:hypothetical protein